MVLKTGDVLDQKYRIIRVIGEGGMGCVYEGEYTRIRRRVAIKALHPTANAADIVTRFEREAQAGGRIQNEHIMEVLDIGTLVTGEPYIVMEFLDGTTLAQRLSTHGVLQPAEAARIAQQVLIGLDAAHKAGIVHRDLKPDNVFLLRQKHGIKDFVKLIDFGVSKFQAADGGDLKVTRMGSLLGTPFYMSPEIARGRGEADARTDIYGLGVILFEALSGRLPFQGDNLNELLFQIVEAETPDIRTHVPNLDGGLAEMILRAMARDPAQRFQTAAEFIAKLDAWMLQRNITPLPPLLASAPALQAARASTAGITANPEPPPWRTLALTEPSPATKPSPPDGAATGGASRAWAGTGAIAEAPRKRSGAVLGVAAAGAVALFAVGALVLRSLGGGAGGGTTTATGRPSATPPAVSTPAASVALPALPNIPSAVPPAASSHEVEAHETLPSGGKAPGVAPNPVWRGTGTGTRPVSPAGASGTPKAKGPDDEIPGMR
jgi:serine/threonine-protein kinase